MKTIRLARTISDLAGEKNITDESCQIQQKDNQ
ncbi:hypothetical protein [Sutcliffiella horikoshii]